MEGEGWPATICGDETRGEALSSPVKRKRLTPSAAPLFSLPPYMSSNRSLPLSVPLVWHATARQVYLRRGTANRKLEGVQPENSDPCPLPRPRRIPVCQLSEPIYEGAARSVRCVLLYI